MFTGDTQASASAGLRFGLSNPGGGATLAGATGRVGITAVNENAGVLQFALVDLTVAEGDIRTELHVTRTDGFTGPVSVHFGSYGLTATENWDYGSLEGTLRWEHGDTSAKSIRVGITLDGEDAEANERFRVVLSRPTGGAKLGAAAVAEVTIDESLPVSPIVRGGNASSVVNASAAPSGGGGATGMLEVLMLGLTLLASLFKARARKTDRTRSRRSSSRGTALEARVRDRDRATRASRWAA